MARLSVDLNRDGLHQIAAPTAFETDGPFEIELRNHGEAIHVHCNVDDELSAVADLDTSNHYIEPYSSRSLGIDTGRISSAVTGRLKIVTGYGAESTYTTITVSPPGTVTDRVDVDETLANPQRSEPTASTPRAKLTAAVADDLSPRVAAGATLGICGLVVTAALTQNTTAVVGSLAIIAGVFAALAITRRT